MSIASDLIRGHTDTIILAHLTEEDSYGYKINKDIQIKTDNQYELKEATLYTVSYTHLPGKNVASARLGFIFCGQGHGLQAPEAWYPNDWRTCGKRSRASLLSSEKTRQGYLGFCQWN